MLALLRSLGLYKENTYLGTGTLSHTAITEASKAKLLPETAASLAPHVLLEWLLVTMRGSPHSRHLANKEGCWGQKHGLPVQTALSRRRNFKSSTQPTTITLNFLLLLIAD